MTFHFIVDKDELLLPWAAQRIPHIGRPEAFGTAKTMGIASGPTPEDRLMAVVVYHMFIPEYRSCMISMVAVTPRWATRGTIRTILRIPFYQYDCNRVWLAIPHTNERLVKFVKAIGFVREGALRDGFGPGIHTITCGMLRREFEQRYEKDGKKRSLAAAAA